ncbi:MAG: hypothetical protein N3D20_02620, partial [Candidatus Pacearchaeota archaeon]|nr:hypothetical protein [Candidatus Pacearchaeota archaeon]
MAYKKYIRKDGKVFGPYYYQSYRDEDGNVRKRYVKYGELGLREKFKYGFFNDGTKSFIYVAIALILIFVGLTYFANKLHITGRVGIDIDDVYNNKEKISGVLRLNLRQGELIPANSKVIASLGDDKKEFLLS